MAANEFEKNARKLLDEFKLHPSEQVWQNVEERIREKKRRRRVIFFIFFSCALLALGGYGIYEIQGTTNKTQGPKINDQLTTITPNPTSKNSDSLHLSSSVNTNSSQNRETEKTLITHKATGQKRQIQKSTIVFRNANDVLKRKDQVPTTSKENEASEKQRLTNDMSSTIQNNTFGNKQSVSLDTNDHAVTLTPDKKNTAITSLVDSTTTKQRTSEQSTNENSPKKNKRSTKKTEWGLNFSAGASTITQDHFSNSSASYLTGNLSQAPGSYQGGRSIYGQAVNDPSFAFVLGVIVRKNISKRSSLSAGIQYSHMADKIKTGAMQTVPQPSYMNFSSYYGAGTQQTHSESFHFIDVPFTYDWRLTNNPKHFLLLNAGISTSFLISTNALVYDTAAGGIYYHDKNSFAHTVINFVPGLSYHFTNKNLEWSLGPQAYFDLNKFIKSDLDQRKYLFFLGINAKLFFEKKK